MRKMPEVRRSGLIVQEVDGEVLVYDQKRDKAHCLNNTAAKVWKYCDGRTTVAEACNLLSQDFASPVDEKVVWYAIDQFSKDHLLEEKTELPAAFIAAGMNRRQMVRTLGLAAMIAVPLVTTILAPTPAQAATCFPSGAACTAGAECCSTVCTANLCT